MLHDFFSVLLMIVVVAGITTVVVNGKGSTSVITALGKAFSGALTAAQGK